jgi:hypothetical protein
MLARFASSNFSYEDTLSIVSKLFSPRLEQLECLFCSGVAATMQVTELVKEISLGRVIERCGKETYAQLL